MPTITIPSSINIKEQLIAVPKRTYEEFLAWQKKIKSVKTFTPTAAEKRTIQKARKNLAEGNYLTLEQLRHELGIKN